MRSAVGRGRGAPGMPSPYYEEWPGHRSILVLLAASHPPPAHRPSLFFERLASENILVHGGGNGPRLPGRVPSTRASPTRLHVELTVLASRRGAARPNASGMARTSGLRSTRDAGRQVFVMPRRQTEKASCANAHRHVDGHAKVGRLARPTARHRGDLERSMGGIISRRGGSRAGGHTLRSGRS